MGSRQPSFEACLKKIPTLGENVVKDLDGIAIQSTQIVRDGKRISGDLLRIQEDNLPSLVETKGRTPKKLPLASGAGLGHHAAFLYDSSINVLAYQLTRNAVSLGLFNAYIAKACECDLFGFAPVIKASELKQLNKMTPKTLLIKVADPAGLDAVEDEQKKLRASLINLRDVAVEGAYVRVQVGLGNRQGQLKRPKLRSLISWLLEQREHKQGKVGAIKVIGKDLTEDDVPLDFIRAQLGDSETLPLGSSTPDERGILF
jgi:hypothetical protein